MSGSAIAFLQAGAVAAWFAALLYAAPLFERKDCEADTGVRLRNALIAGTAIPLALGLLHVFYAASCFGVVGVLCVARYRYRRTARLRWPAASGACVVVFAVACTGWPQIVRPLLDGDSLSYHLPNAAAWVHAHSVWTTSTRYWWYPGGSELFAAGILTIGGPLFLGWAGIAPLLVIGIRLWTWLQEIGYEGWPGALLVGALLTSSVFAKQSGTLENDSWLLALLLESIWALKHARLNAALPLAALTLMKPTGVIFAGIVAVVFPGTIEATLFVSAIALGAYVMWFGHDALLWRNAIVPPASTAVPDTFETTIAYHGFNGLRMLARAAWSDSPLIGLCGAAAVSAAILVQNRRVAVAASACLIVGIISPFGFDNGTPQLETGQSLRFFLPAIALGFIVLARVALPLARAFGLAAAILMVINIRAVTDVFWNDSTTRDVVYVAAILACLTAVAVVVNGGGAKRKALISLLACATVFGFALRARIDAGTHPVDYYTDQIPLTNGTRSHFYREIAVRKPKRLIVTGFNAGVIAFVSPTTDVVDGLDREICAESSLLDAPVAIRFNGGASDVKAQAAICLPTVVYSDTYTAIRSK